MSSSSLTGTRIKLDRSGDREHGRCGNIAIVTTGYSPHNAGLVCAGCGRHRGWLSATAITFIQETQARFGTTEIITIKTISSPRLLLGAGGGCRFHSATESKTK